MFYQQVHELVSAESCAVSGKPSEVLSYQVDEYDIYITLCDVDSARFEKENIEIR